jgi:hypothetical protein
MAGSEENPGPGGPNEVQEPAGTPATPIDAPETPVTPSAGPAPAPEAREEVSERPRTDWRDRRIGELTARTRELRAELERVRAGQAPSNGQAPQPGQPPGYNQGPPNQQTIDAQIEQRARILAENQDFNRRCNETAEIGRRAYTDFDMQVGRLVGLVDNNDPQGIASYNAFLNAALETGEASKIIYSLGSDLNEASRILSLSPLKMAVELTKMAIKPVAQISNAPRPINPASTAAQAARSSTSPDDPGSDHMSTEEWMRRRNEQIDGRRVRR